MVTYFTDSTTPSVVYPQEATPPRIRIRLLWEQHHPGFCYNQTNEERFCLDIAAANSSKGARCDFRHGPEQYSDSDSTMEHIKTNVPTVDTHIEGQRVVFDDDNPQWLPHDFRRLLGVRSRFEIPISFLALSSCHL